MAGSCLEGIIKKKQMAKTAGGEGFRFFVITGLEVYLITGFPV